MKTQPNPPINLPAQAWRYLVHTLYNSLPPPTVDTPEALTARNQAAIARIAALAPVNANEAELAAQCICARAQAEDVMRLIRLHSDDIKLVMQLNNQYSSMVRTSLSAHSHLMKAQQQRRHNYSEWPTLADDTMLVQEAAASAMLHAAPIKAPAPTPAAEEIPKTETKSQGTANETPPRQPRPRAINFTAATPQAAHNAGEESEIAPALLAPRPDHRQVANAAGFG